MTNSILATGLARLGKWCPLGLGLVLVLTGLPALAATPVFLAFESEALDLDNGVVTAGGVSAAAGGTANGADIYSAYHAGRTPNAVLMPLPGTEMVTLRGAAFTEVTAADIDEVNFSSSPDDISFESVNTVLVRTPSGAVYKVGNPSETDTGVTFVYAQLR